MGRPRASNTNLPVGLRHSEVKGFYYYGSHIVNGKRSYKHIGKVDISEALAIWEKFHQIVMANKPAKPIKPKKPYIYTESDKKYAADWRRANPDYERNRRAANPNAARIKNNNYRARKRENGGMLSKDIAQKLLILQRGKCACCGKPLGKNYHLDHIVPVAKGGSNTDDNIQLLRSTCNHEKSAKDPIKFMQERGFLL